MWSAAPSAADAEAYDGFVAAARGGHFSQARAWAEVTAAARSWAARWFLARREGRVVGAALVLQPRLFRTLTLPFARIERGPVCDAAADLPQVLHALVREAHRRGIVRLSVMPYWSGEAKPEVERMLRDGGFSGVQTFAGRHARTARLDLHALPEGDLFAGRALHQVRQNVRRAERAGAVARRGERRDFEAFCRMHGELLRLEGSRPPAAAWYEALAEYFLAGDGRGAMFVCEHEGRAISAIFLARFGRLATYVVGASSGEELRFPKMILPMAAGIAWAKGAGLDCLDLGGIPMEGDTDKKRNSIAEFKRSFSRNEIDLVHEHVRWF